MGAMMIGMLLAAGAVTGALLGTCINRPRMRRWSRQARLRAATRALEALTAERMAQRAALRRLQTLEGNR